MTIEEFTLFYIEGSFAIRDLQVQFNLNIGEIFQDKSNEEIKTYAKVIKKHKSFLTECVEVYKQWPELEKQYTKDKSWSDLVKLAGIEKEKRPRRAVKTIISERLEKHKLEFEQTGDVYVKGKLDEDKELLDEE